MKWTCVQDLLIKTVNEEKSGESTWTLNIIKFLNLSMQALILIINNMRILDMIAVKIK